MTQAPTAFESCGYIRSTKKKRERESGQDGVDRIYRYATSDKFGKPQVAYSHASDISCRPKQIHGPEGVERQVREVLEILQTINKNDDLNALPFMLPIHV